jgi:flavin reductase (DIM6/NTAB) family NADH-FMN oxidoreductase RutF
MEGKFIKTDPLSLQENAIKIIGIDSMLITAGTKSSFNTMTAAWAGLGYLWKKPVSFIFIRPQRYTYQFVEKNEYYTLSFFEERQQKILEYCGNVSGRDVDKTIKTGLIPLETELGNIYFDQARLVFECRKLYFQDMNPDNFVEKNIIKMYPTHDFHRMYVGEITGCWIKKV